MNHVGVLTTSATVNLGLTF